MAGENLNLPAPALHRCIVCGCVSHAKIYLETGYAGEKLRPATRTNEERECINGHVVKVRTKTSIRRQYIQSPVIIEIFTEIFLKVKCLDYLSIFNKIAYM